MRNHSLLRHFASPVLCGSGAGPGAREISVPAGALCRQLRARRLHDIIARLLGAALGPSRPAFIVENRSGAAAIRRRGGGRSPPDGYTLHLRRPEQRDQRLAATRSSRFDFLRDMTPVAGIDAASTIMWCRRRIR